MVAAEGLTPRARFQSWLHALGPTELSYFDSLGGGGG